MVRPRKYVVHKILMSLTRNYDAIVSIIEETKDMETLTVQEVIGSIKSFDQRLQKHAENSNESAFQTLSLSSKNSNSDQASSSQGKSNVSKAKKDWKNKGKKWEGKSNQQGKKNYEEGSSSSSYTKCKICDKMHLGECWFKGKPKCFNCNLFGHVKNDCPNRGLQNQQANLSEDQSGNMFCVTHATTEPLGDDVWLVDSACSNHMTANSKLLTGIDYTKTTRVKMGNGMMVGTKGKGSIAVKTKKRNNVHKRCYVGSRT